MVIPSQFTQPPGPLADTDPSRITYLNRGDYFANVRKEKFPNPCLCSCFAHRFDCIKCFANCLPIYSVYAGGMASFNSPLFIQSIPIASRAAAMLQFPPPFTETKSIMSLVLPY